MGPSSKQSEYGTSLVSDTDYHRPRRPNPDTIQYLCSLPIDVKTAKDEIQQRQSAQEEQAQDEDEEEESQMLSASLNAIEEIQTELASLACDERCSQQVERLATIACDKDLGKSYGSARRLLNGLSGYYLHLSCHRYGSHVAQTVMTLAGAPHFVRYEQQLQKEREECDSDQANEEEDDLKAMPTLQELIMSASDELLPQACLLSTHVCGSHVLRAVLCSLMGVKVTTKGPQGSVEDGSFQLRLGSKKKKKKKKASSGTSYSHGTTISVSLEGGFVTPESFLEKLSLLMESLLGCQMNSSSFADSNALGLMCHPSAGPLMHTLVKGLAAVYASTERPPASAKDDTAGMTDSITSTRRGIMTPEPHFCAESLGDIFVKCILHHGDATRCSDVIYGLSGEVYGSRFLEVVLCTANDDLYQSVLERGAFLSTTSTALGDYAQHDVSNFVVQTILRTARTRDQVDILVKSLLPMVSDGTLVKASRRGVLWRLVEMSAKWRIGQESLIKAIPRGFFNESKSSATMQECIAPLLSLQAPEGEGLRLQMDVNGARTVFNLLLFVPRLCGKVIDGILGLGSSMLVFIAKDGMGSCW
jgi:hypothetical protein